MTNREKLIDFFMDELTEDNPWKGNIKGLVDKLIAAGFTFQKWIPVTERLPEVFVSVLICIPSDAPLPTVKEAYWANGSWGAKMWIYSANEVTHWLPLPEPPKEDA